MTHLRLVSVIAGFSAAAALAACGRKDSSPQATAPSPRDGGAAIPAPPGPTPPAATSAAGLALGGWRSCAIMSDHAVRCWGANPEGLSIAGETRDATATPTTIAGLAGVSALAVGWTHTCALVDGGAVWCWGDNQDGELGDGTTAGRATPAAVPGLRAAGVAVGSSDQGEGDFSCAWLADGSVRCWGNNRSGAIGGGDERVTSPRPVAGVSGVAGLAAGEGHVCALLGDGRVTCWGRNDHGQCGAPPSDRLAPTVVAGVDQAAEIAAGPEHTCARRRDGAVLCWGSDQGSQLGGTGSPHLRPAPLAGAADVVGLALGHQHTCVLRRDGQVACVGGSDRGSFGFPRGCKVGHEEHHAGPSGVVIAYCGSLTTIPALTGAVEIAHGEDHLCARYRDGSARCLGGAGRAELGNRALGAAGSHTPVAVDLGAAAAGPTHEAEVLAVRCAGSSSCALMADHTVRCWGDGELGQLGVAGGHFRGPAAGISKRPHPEPIPGLAGVTAIGFGGYSGCAVVDGGALRCWGINGSGELGDGSRDERSGPVTVSGLSGATDVSVSPDSSSAHVCARLGDGTVRCWGANGHGQVGSGAADAWVLAPAAVPGLTGVTQVAAGYGYTCAVTSAGQVLCFGDNSRGQLGDGTTTEQRRPAAVSGVTGAVEVALGYDHACARRTDGGVTCWGAAGGWAPGAPPDRPVRPTAITGLTGVTALEAGYAGFLAVRGDGTVTSFYLESTPLRLQTVDGLADVVAVSSSGYHSCALRRDRTLRCWGDNGSGQMGDAERGLGGEQKVPSPVRW